MYACADAVGVWGSLTALRRFESRAVDDYTKLPETSVHTGLYHQNQSSRVVGFRFRS